MEPNMAVCTLYFAHWLQVCKIVQDDPHISSLIYRASVLDSLIN